MKLGFASDHRGYELKEYLKNYYKDLYEIVDYGTNSEESVDYPDFAFKLGKVIQTNDVDFGILIHNGSILRQNGDKVKGVRCAKVSNEEEAMYTREDNDSNIVAFGEKTSKEDAIKIINKFVETKFSNLEKHQRRINKITSYEEGTYEG